MSTSAINEEQGTIDLHKLLPGTGDSVMIVNCGDHFEMTQHSWKASPVPPAYLTDDDIKRLKQGIITWN